MLYENILTLNWTHDQTFIGNRINYHHVAANTPREHSPWLLGNTVYLSGDIILQFRWLAYGDRQTFKLDLPLEYGYRHLENTAINFEDGDCADDMFVDETVLELLTHYIEWQPIVKKRISAILNHHYRS